MTNLETKLDILVQITLRARCFFEFWWVYEGAPTRPKYLDAMNQYSEFFRFDTHAHQVAYTIYLCQIFESKLNTLNIRGLLKEAKARNLSEHSIASVEQLLQEAEPILKKLVIIRSNLFAHRSLSLNYKTAFHKAAITPNQIRRLCEIALEVVNLLRIAFGQDELSFTDLSTEDLTRLLEAIKTES
jgi:hypothetical protein